MSKHKKSEGAVAFRNVQTQFGIQNLTPTAKTMRVASFAVGLALLAGCAENVDVEKKAKSEKTVETVKDEAKANAAPAAAVTRVSTNPLLLRNAVKFGVISSAKVSNAQSNIKVNANEVAISKSAFFPELFVDVSPVSDDLKIATGRAGVRYTLYDFGERTANLRAATANVERARYDILAEVDDSITQTGSRYIALSAATRLVQSARTYSNAIAALEERVRSRVEIGAASDADLKEIEIAKLNASNSLNEALSEQSDAKAELASLIGVRPQSVQGISGLSKALALPRLKASSIDPKSYPKVAAREKELAAAVYKRDATKAGLLPKLGLSASAGVDVTDNASVKGAGVRVGPELNGVFSLGGANKKKKENAALNVDIAQRNVQEEIRLARLAAVQAELEFNSAQSEVSRRTSIVDATMKKREILAEEYETGARTLRDLVDVEEEFFGATRNLVESYQRSLLARLDMLASFNLASTKLYRTAKE